MDNRVKVERGRRILLIIMAIFFIVLTAASFYMLKISLRPELKGNSEAESYQEIFNDYPFLKPWVDSLNQKAAIKDTFIVNDKGVKLHGYYIAAAKPTKKTAVIVHGYTDNAIRMFMIGHLYNHEMGYNILLPDLQMQGKSEGKAIQMGWKDRLDVIKWMDVTRAIYGDSINMVVHGISMGAATTMMVSGEKMPSYVKCFVEDCGYTSVWDQFAKELKEDYHISSFPLMDATSLLCKIKYGWSFKEASALNQVKKCKLPMFFIHGDADTYVPTWMVHPLYEAKPQPKELWIVPGAIHAKSYKQNPQLYLTKVKAFVDKYIF